MNKKLSTTILSVALIAGGISAGSLAANAYDTTDPSTDASIEPTVEPEASPNGLLAQVEPDAPDAPDTETPDGTDGERPGGERHGRRGGCGDNEAVAELLGMTTEELHEAREAGASLAEIATDAGVSVDEVIQTIVDDKAEHLAEKVAEGALTQAEADERLAELEPRTADRVNGVNGVNADTADDAADA